MTDNIQKQFFDTFGIEPKYYCSYHDCNCPIEDIGKFNKKCPKQAVTQDCDARSKQVLYPQITDRIVLELICIHNQYSHPFSIYGERKEFLKNDILECMINMLNYFYEHEMGEYSELKHQVRTLFEEG